MKIKRFYNPETDKTEMYTEIWKLELVKVRDEQQLLVRNHYWQDSEGELWGDFENPMENVYHAFKAYRDKKGYMDPSEIRELRENLRKTVRDFANVLGIAPSSLTQIENNQRVQTKYQENLFESARESYNISGYLPKSWDSRVSGEQDEYRPIATKGVYESFDSSMKLFAKVGGII